ncbi:type II toxin-antitoxin system VapC family toxin [Candidatus Entotheonella palauensis]|uniref:type II toxin-antitoxin system VapC family toxin n=1 Tax=Candidatus Entotheonella palauensis TaxID=93172 RepID=UPI0015C4B507|nr:type II toxin-antitoxin system VapC family toxin [Candidatus Entotheonella palauensis]
MAEETLDVLVNTEVLQEILYRYGAIGELEKGLRLANLAVDQVGGNVLPVTLADMQLAFELMRQYGTSVKSRDAVHAATMLNNDLTYILSADRHFDQIESITRLALHQAAELHES